jgi:lipopolysaccharide export system protein LptA
MPVSISRLRRWLAVSAILVALMVAGAYFYARHRVENALKQVPGKIGLDIQQTAEGFTVSRSEQGRTMFKVQASRAVQFKAGGRTQLHDVTITLYGRDSSRFDQIYGQSFEYDPQSGNVVGKGPVQIDLQANPEGVLHPDQAAPKELKNPIHLTTSDLVFNQKTGDAYTHAKVDFRIPQARGSAVGVTYAAKNNLLTLQSQVEVHFAGSTPATVTAASAVLDKLPRTVLLDHPHVITASEKAQSEQATLFLRPDNALDHVLATGDVQLDSAGPKVVHTRSQQLEIFMDQNRDVLRSIVLSGDVSVQQPGPQVLSGSADRLTFDFTGKNVVSSVHAQQDVRLSQQETAKTAGAQDIELTAPAVHFLVAAGRHLQEAETVGAGPRITLWPAGTVPTAGQQTLVTAAKFEAHFDDAGQISALRGEPNAQIVTTGPGQPNRVSTSRTVEAIFHPGKGLQEIIQQGSVAYADGERKAWADQARYTPSDQFLSLSGSPRVIDGSMTTTANSMRMNRTTGDAYATGDVKSTYNDLKSEPGGALLASSSPIHVTSGSMAAHRTPAVAIYTGNARLWQDANIVQAPSIQFDRDHRSVLAQGTAGQEVSTVIVQVDQNGKATPVAITSARLTYVDSQRRAHFEGGVTAKGADATVTSDQMDVFLQPRGQATPNQVLAGAGRLEKIIAEGHITVSQPSRHGNGDLLVYTATDDKFVMTGGPPSIFDAEHGKITGVSLTFYRHDDRVLVEGNSSNPTVTQTRVAR